VIVTMRASKLKTKHKQNIYELGLKVYKKDKNTRAHRSLRLLPELERRLDSTLDSRQGFACATTTTLKPL
jgi:hypothetical protein